MPEPAGGLTSGEQLGPTKEKLESQAWTPARPPNAVRLALRLQTHGEGVARECAAGTQEAIWLRALQEGSAHIGAQDYLVLG
jgi:hypothetical protein